MSAVTHTPWEVVPENTHHGFYVTDAAGRTVCDLYFIDRSDIDAAVRQFDGAEPNARLIAAAPDLLRSGARLQAARKAHKLAPSAENLSRVRIASDAFDAAIARARGEQDGGGE